MVEATLRHKSVDRLLRAFGFKAFSEVGAEPLDRVAALLGSDEMEMFDESGSLLISAEAIGSEPHGRKRMGSRLEP